MRSAPRVLNIHPGQPFLATFARALLEGRVAPGLGAAAEPLALAGATIYVPTRRAARALAAELARHLPGPAVLLPKIVPLGSMEAIETGLLFEAGEGPVEGVPDAIDPIRRRLILMQLVHAWAKQLAFAITHVEDGAIRTDSSEALLVARAPAQAWSLAGDLAGLIDEMIVEGADWSRLQSLAPDEFDRYWSVTIEFLKIASRFWPEALAELQAVDPAERQRLLVDREIARLSAAADAPVIAIGSTGTNRATARLLAAIARLERGAVILPGLDKTMDEAAWTAIAGDEVRKAEPAAGHPQAALHRLLPILGVTRADVEDIGAPDPVLARRHDVLSQAFLPADVTESWPDYLRSVSPEAMSEALAGVAIVAAADEREEALALAICMREELETPGRTAALVTPDRALARRVRAELARWNIEIDDSGGEPLATSTYGVLARLALACVERPCMAAEWLALLAHPHARLGFRRGEIDRLSGLLEIAVLRGSEINRDAPLAMVQAARDAKGERAHPAVKRIRERDWDALAVLVERVVAALAPLRELSEGAPLAAFVAAHARTLAALTRAEDGAQPAFDESRQVFDAVFANLAEHAPADILFRPADYGALVDQVAREEIVRGPVCAHPRLKILGLLESRLVDADLMLLAGLDETIWPPQTETGAFLNRPMRAELGLTPPERRIGQTAHDFVQALGARHVVVSRAAKRGGAPTVPSRFLQRLQALAGDVYAECQARGDRLLEYARRLDRPETVAPTPRPRPRPPLALRPTSLGVTAVEKLRRDPYEIFAQRILGLSPLEDLGAEPGAREAGTQLHAVLGEFVARWAGAPLPADAHRELCALARARLAILLENPDYRAFQWPRIEAGLGHWLEWERGRRAGVERTAVETSGELAIRLDDGSVFTLNGTADRIDILAEGGCEIVDYKSGRIPSQREIKANFAPQLPLEAAMVARGAFAQVGAREVRDAVHVKVGADAPIRPESVAKDRPLVDVANEAYDGLLELLNQFRDENTPYLARPYPQFASRYSDYDHLARVKEWSAGGEGGEE